MKKTIRFFAIFTVIAVVFTSLFCIPSLAASSSIRVSAKNITPGGNVTVTVTINGGEAMYATEGFVSYNASVLQFVSGTSANGGGGSVKIVGTPGGAASQSYTLNFKAIGLGTSDISLNSAQYVGSSPVGVAGSSTSVTVANPAPSSNANLSSLSVVGASLSPAFSQKTTTYSASVANDVEKITLKASVASADATLVGTGEKALKEGDNSFVITVTAASGTKKSYTVNVRRRLKDELTLEEILTVSVNNAQKKLVQDISALPVLNGFTVSSAQYKTTSVGVLKDKDEKYTLYYLTEADGSNPKLYTLNGDDFELLPTVESAGKTFIVEEPPIKKSPAGYNNKTITLNGKKYKAFGFENKKMKDFYVLYCFSGNSREYYTYDSKENVMQRLPMFTFEENSEVSAKTAKAEKIDKNVFDKFLSLSLSYKLFIIGAAAAVITIFVLLIILLSSGKSKRNSSTHSQSRNYGDLNNSNNPRNGFIVDLNHKFDD